MIGYVLGDASLLQPVLQRGLGETVIEADKDLVCRFAVLIAIIIAYQSRASLLMGLFTSSFVFCMRRVMYIEPSP